MNAASSVAANSPAERPGTASSSATSVAISVVRSSCTWMRSTTSPARRKFSISTLTAWARARRWCSLERFVSRCDSFRNRMYPCTAPTSGYTPRREPFGM